MIIAQNISHKKIAVYTAIFGSHDDLNIPKHTSLRNEADFFCFTDNPDLKSDFYKVIHLKPKYKELVRNARYIKIMGHPILNEYNYNIWLDAAFELTIDTFDDLIRSVSDTGLPLSVFKHNYRNCVYQEAAICIEWDKDYFFIIFYQMLKYFTNRMPKEFGLYETGILVKNLYSPLLLPLTTAWQREIDSGSRRDQLSLPYCSWKYRIDIGLLKGSAFNNKFAFYHPHKSNVYIHQKSLKLNFMGYIDRKFKFGKKKALKWLKYFEASSPVAE